MKKTICLVTDWYPTKENLYKGLFFKEQAFALYDSFNFIVIRYKEHIRIKPGQRFSVKQINKEKNTVEYEVNVNVPLRIYISDSVHDYRIKHIDKSLIDGVGNYVSSARKTFTQKTINTIYNIHFKDMFDVLYCVDAQNEAWVLKCFSKVSGRPYVVGEHAPVPWPGSVIKDVNKHAIEGASRFLAISYDKVRQLLLQNIKLPDITYVGNMVNESVFRLRTKLCDIKTILIVAANSFYKNYDLFIDVMNRLTDITSIPFKVMIVGYGANKGYSKNKDEFEKKISNTKFSDRVELIPEVPHSEIQNIYARADVFVMTSIQEGQPVSAMEAACC